MKYQSCFVVIAFALTSTLLLGCESKVKRDFKAGCQAGGLDRSTCSCIYDKVEEHYSPEFMEKMSDVTVRETMQPPEGFNVVMANAIQQCQK
ncbi:hypothetical protein E0H77_05835 [Acinetobacter sp. ANC 4633]|uniref:hypothetical protein n=1 Tax=Acinetobacter sp. ANC 4633 TaxID=2529845 RepID=UPI00104041F2|nr:hypothetical protein [Acinetobacter sp. ANC 4633]TCB27129.1 hypothetical protein E0H77_05835 [Acinetobacter sp. ANC 4633]